MFKLNQ